MLDDKKIKELRKEYNKNEKKEIKHRIFNKVPLVVIMTFLLYLSNKLNISSKKGWRSGSPFTWR